MLNIQNLSVQKKNYKKSDPRIILDKISLNLNKQEIFAYIGPNGA
jgi:ABC-type multidrug transport system ATPase subunit